MMVAFQFDITARRSDHQQHISYTMALARLTQIATVVKTVRAAPVADSLLALL